MLNEPHNGPNEFNPRLLEAVLRNDFPSFIGKCFNSINPAIEFLPNWHIDLIAEHLEMVQRGEIKRLIINMPPRALKSVCVNVAWPAWLLGHNPQSRIMSASYSQALSTKHSLDTRNIMQEDWYIRLFPETILSKQHNLKAKFMTTKHGFRYATSVGGTATGEGGDFLIIDDPHNPAHISSPARRRKVVGWYEQVFSTRLNNASKGAIILVMQSLHEEDLSGYLLDRTPGAWKVLTIPAVATEDITRKIYHCNIDIKTGEALNAKRDDLARLKMIEKEMGAAAFSAQYQQQPANSAGNLISRSYFNYYDMLPDSVEYVVQSWDTAITNNENSDYSVCTSWAISNGKYYLIHVHREKLEYPALKRAILCCAKHHKASFVLIEDKGSGQSVIQDLRQEGNLIIIPIKVKQDKVTRFATSLTEFEAQKVLFPRYIYWLRNFEDELLAFPSGKHDDIVDSVSQFLNYMKSRSVQALRFGVKKL